MKSFVVGTHKKHLTKGKVLLMSTHNMFSLEKSEKYLSRWTLLLSRGMQAVYLKHELFECMFVMKLEDDK